MPQNPIRHETQPIIARDSKQGAYREV